MTEKTRFDVAVDNLLPRLTDQERGDLLLRLARASFNPNSVAGVEVAIAMHLDSVAAKLPIAIRAAAVQAVGDVKATAEAAVSAAKAALVTTETAVVERVADRIGATATEALAVQARISSRRSTATIAATTLLAATVALSIGWQMGAMATTAAEGTVAAVVGGDANLWLPLIRDNDLRQAVATQCRGGYSGCGVRLWFDRGGQATADAVPGDLAGRMLPLFTWFDLWPGWQVALCSLLVGLQVRRLAMVTRWPPLRILLGGPLREGGTE